MHTQYCGRSEIIFITDRLTLPLFLASRVSARKDSEYITRTEQVIKKTCEEAKQPNKKMRSVYEKLIGKYAKNPQPCINVRRIKMVRDHSDNKPFHLPPNIYETAKIPFESRRGLGSAYWHRLPETKLPLARKAAKDVDWQFYNIPCDIDRLADRHNHYKGKFWTKTAMKSKIRKEPLQITCKFDRSIISPKVSCVPEKLMSYIMRNQSFSPAVGRYEIKYASDCWYCMLTKMKRSNPQTATITSQQRRGGKRRLHQMLNAATLSQTTRLNNKLAPDTVNAKLFHNNKRPPRVPISRRPPSTMPIIHTNIRFNSIISGPRLNAKRALNSPARRASSIKKFQLRRKEPLVPKQLPPKFEYKRNFKFKPLPSPKILVAKEQILPDLSTGETPYFYFRPLDVKNYLKKSMEGQNGWLG